MSCIAVTPSSPNNLPIGSNQQFTATGTYSDGSNADLTSQVTWVSDTPATVTVSSGGLATGIGGKTVKFCIIVCRDQPNIVLTVEALTSIEITPGNSANLNVGSDQDLLPPGHLRDGFCRITPMLGWTRTRHGYL